MFSKNPIVQNALGVYEALREMYLDRAAQEGREGDLQDAEEWRRRAWELEKIQARTIKNDFVDEFEQEINKSYSKQIAIGEKIARKILGPKFDTLTPRQKTSVMELAAKGNGRGTDIKILPDGTVELSHSARGTVRVYRIGKNARCFSCK